MNLNFFTAEYPYRSNEAFIENEIPYLAQKFQKVKVFPHYFKEEKIRSIPKNASVCQIKISDSNLTLPFNYKILIVKFFILEFFSAPNKWYYLKHFRKWLSLLKVGAEKSYHIERNNLLLNDAVCYSFWMNDWALVLTFLKQKKVII